MTLNTAGQVNVPTNLSAGTVYVGTTSAATNGSGRLHITGFANSASVSPSILCYTGNDV